MEDVLLQADGDRSAWESERQQMLAVCHESEKQICEGQENLENALNKIQTLEEIASSNERKLDEVRERIVKIAELFEKKKITSQYSFDVLCDFIFDKAKRLFQKYENAQIKLKGGESEKHKERKAF